MRCTERRLTPAALASSRLVQWVLSPGGGPKARSTTRCTVLGGSGGLPGLRGLSRNSPSTPSAMNRACQVHTTGFDLPDRRMISAVPQPSAVARITLARHTCFCGALRSATIASNRRRSARVTLTTIPALIMRAWTASADLGIVRMNQTTSHEWPLRHLQSVELVRGPATSRGASESHCPCEAGGATGPAACRGLHVAGILPTLQLGPGRCRTRIPSRHCAKPAHDPCALLARVALLQRWAPRRGHRTLPAGGRARAFFGNRSNVSRVDVLPRGKVRRSRATPS